MIHGKIIKYHSRAYVPAYLGDNQTQLHLRVREEVTIGVGHITKVRLGIGLKLPNGYIANITSYLENLSLHGISLATPITIDASNTKEIALYLVNYTKQTATLHAGAPIASMVICPIELVRLAVQYPVTKVSHLNS